MKKIFFLAICWGFIGLSGCDLSTTTSSSISPNFAPELIADSEPKDPLSVGEVRSSAAPDQAICIEGRIDGTSQPFVNGLAAFTMVDFSVPDCCGDECTTPECSPEEMAQKIVTVKFVDDKNKTLAVDARDLLNVKKKDAVVIEGQVQRDQHGNLSVLAKRIFIRSSPSK